MAFHFLPEQSLSPKKKKIRGMAIKKDSDGRERREREEREKGRKKRINTARIRNKIYNRIKKSRKGT